MMIAVTMSYTGVESTLLNCQHATVMVALLLPIMVLRRCKCVQFWWQKWQIADKCEMLWKGWILVHSTGKGSGKLNGRSDGQLRTFLSSAAQIVSTCHWPSPTFSQVVTQIVANMVTQIVAQIVKRMVHCTHSTQLFKCFQLATENHWHRWCFD